MLALTIALAAQVTLDNRIVRAAPAGEDAAAYVAIGNAGAMAARFAATGDRAAAWQAAPAPAAPAAPALAAELQPLASCWRATFPNGQQRHALLYGDARRPLRPRRACRRGPAYALFRREPSIAGTRRRAASATSIIASDGGYSAGFAEPTAAGLDFPQRPGCRRRRLDAGACAPSISATATAIGRPAPPAGPTAAGAKCGR